MVCIHPLSVPQAKSLHAQFNLEIEEVECAQREIDHWRRDPSCPMTIEVAPVPFPGAKALKGRGDSSLSRCCAVLARHEFPVCVADLPAAVGD